MSSKWPTAVDLFSGCGAMTQALKARHFNVLAAIEKDLTAAKTYKRNHKTVNLYKRDIRKFGPTTILENDMSGERIDLLAVCAPCQPFSSQNNYNGKGGNKDLILESVKFAEILKPKIIFFENVRGLLSEKFAPLLEKLQQQLQKINYKLDKPREVDAADFGVPQRRKRSVMFGAAADYQLPKMPKPITPPGERITVNETISHLEDLKAGQESEIDELHVARNHEQKTIERIKHVSPGGNRLEIPEELWMDCHKEYDGHLDVLGRMDGEKVAPTLTRGCTDVYKGRFTHPEDNRAITLREASLLQTFPEEYEFSGNSSDISSQIGNAVPVKLIEELTPAIREVI